MRVPACDTLDAAGGSSGEGFGYDAERARRVVRSDDKHQHVEAASEEQCGFARRQDGDAEACKGRNVVERSFNK